MELAHFVIKANNSNQVSGTKNRKCRNLEDVVSGKDATGVAVVLVLANGVLHLLLDRQKFLILGTQFDEHRTRRLGLQWRRRGQTGAAGRRRRGRR